jgi:hypothetical protein
MREAPDGSYQLAVELMDPASTKREELAQAKNPGLHRVVGEGVGHENSYLEPGVLTPASSASS